MAELIIQSGKHHGKKLLLSEAKILIGRSPECHIRLASAEISKQHCLLRSTPEGIFVTDLGSRNGTLVNDQPITEETQLKPGDRLRVGPMEFRVPHDKPSASASPAVAKSKGKRVSDDEIAHWLTDEPHEADPSGDTTTIATTESALQPPERAAPPEAAARSQPAPTAPEPPRKQFKTVAEEGADIIRRWWQKQGGEGA